MSSSSPRPPTSRAASPYGCCCHRPLLASTSAPTRSRGARLALTLSSSSLPLPAGPRSRSRSRRVACRAADEPGPAASNGDEAVDDAPSPPADSVVQADAAAETDNTKDESPNAEPLNSALTSLQNIDRYAKAAADSAAQTKDESPNAEPVSAAVKSLQNIDRYVNAAADSAAQEQLLEVDVNVASGSPLPGMKQQLEEAVSIPKATVDILKDQVFSFDTFFVTSHEPYEGGILFKGNLRGVPAKSFEKITTRLENKFGDEFKVFLLINPEDEKPVAVVVPKQTVEPATGSVPEWAAAGAFGVVTIFTLLLRNVPVLQDNLLSTFDNLELLKDGLPGALVTGLIVGVHEIGHILAAKDAGVKLSVPYFVPSWQIGSFGGITRIVNIVRNRGDLLKVAAAGPVAGFSLGFGLLLLGFTLPPSDGLGIIVDPAVFHQSFLLGGLAKLILGDVLKEGTQLSINPLVLWAWAGLLINAINSIPAGELDGGRIALAMWGRKVSSRLGSVTIALLGLSSLFSDVAFYWAVLIFFLQRGPIAPLSEEITEPENIYIGLGVAILFLGLLVCLPYPFLFDPSQVTDFDF
ncbi:probable zinc metalloprotease EGY2, chloroplastic isoform X4 [Triticum dicoccoides]|uniref:probable zinc metalloprotease EGY2, chloroplastic isoform X4 n=1 Tax=Triticum dicoccoides TaxID=85692 RepID=UPI00188FE295|nr:probable zinc metalloprotease EGY2, chloroplastic isoform X4 [Triticum dicoccoides]XP_044338516.1 probable zinc metalloprotease EGY2, chloroplastic isoform X2 [Triticum aestivum]